jgi:hypothetical protein
MILWRYHEGWAAYPGWAGWHLWTYAGRGGWPYAGRGWWFRRVRRGDALCLADFGVTHSGRVVSTDLCVRREVPW